jgi:hypothetical protein
MTDDAALRAWADFELEWLWGHLRDAHRQANAGPFQVWTIGCESIGERIQSLTAILGPISWRRIQIPGIADGWFAKVNEILEIENPDLPDDEGIAYAQMWVQRQIDSVR